MLCVKIHAPSIHPLSSSQRNRCCPRTGVVVAIRPGHRLAKLVHVRRILVPVQSGIVYVRLARITPHRQIGQAEGQRMQRLGGIVLGHVTGHKATAAGVGAVQAQPILAVGRAVGARLACVDGWQWTTIVISRKDCIQLELCYTYSPLRPPLPAVRPNADSRSAETPQTSPHSAAPPDTSSAFSHRLH